MPSHGVASYSVARSKGVASPTMVLIYRTPLGLVRSYDHGRLLFLFPSLAHPAGPRFTRTLSALASTPSQEHLFSPSPPSLGRKGEGLRPKGLRG